MLLCFDGVIVVFLVFVYNLFLCFFFERGFLIAVCMSLLFNVVFVVCPCLLSVFLFCFLICLCVCVFINGVYVVCLGICCRWFCFLVIRICL